MTVDAKLYIAGEWTDGSTGDHYQLMSPGSGEHIANIPIAGQSDIDRAVAAARQAQDEFRHWSAFERADLCKAIADAIEPHHQRRGSHPNDGTGQALSQRVARRHHGGQRVLPQRGGGREAAVG